MHFKPSGHKLVAVSYLGRVAGWQNRRQVAPLPAANIINNAPRSSSWAPDSRVFGGARTYRPVRFKFVTSGGREMADCR